MIQEFGRWGKKKKINCIPAPESGNTQRVCNIESSTP